MGGDFSHGLTLGILVGAVSVLTILVIWDFIASVRVYLKKRHEVANYSPLKRISYIAMSQHNDSAAVNRLFRLKR